MPPLARPTASLAALLALGALVAGCRGAAGDAPDHEAPPAARGEAPAPDGRLFTRLPSSYTGVRFVNRLHDTPEFNVFTYRNFYNGGGVAVGDLTGDGLPELVLTANQGGPKLYQNLGKFQFRDVTRASGLTGGGWTTGVTLADVNGDGRLDVFLGKAGNGAPAERANQLWVNEGASPDGTVRLRERAREFGLADEGYATHAAFLDADRDGDLDLFLINNSPRPVTSFGMRNTRRVRDPHGGHKFFLNQGGRYVDASERAGVYGSEIGFGLGLAVGDVNRDGVPDVYVANDFFERDYLYLGKGDGTFDEVLDRQMPVASYYSMGLDVADVDNDGWPDVYTTDMLPEDEYRLKASAAYEGWDVYQTKLRNGYHHQSMRNMLQRNNGDGSFSDVGQLAGVDRTDWSWSALIADLDLDGLKDVFVTNGLLRDVTNQDYIAFLADRQTMADATKGRRVDYLKLIAAMDSAPLPDYAFRNRGDLTFENVSKAWGLDTPNLSNGAAYGDLDGDGALDLVVNNVHQEAFVYRNNVRALHPDRRWLQVRLEGEGMNRFAVGARVTAWHGGARPVQAMQELAPARGFQSSVDYALTFGLGADSVADSLTVDWPDGRRTVRRDVRAGQALALRQAEAPPAPAARPAPASRTLLAAVDDSAAFDYAHRENDFVDFDRERLIPKLVSTEGPYMAVGDANGDGREDAFVGGAKDQPGQLLLQDAGGRFRRTPVPAFDADAISEDLGAAFFDADGDRDLDLYVVSGGSEYSDMAPALQDRLYLNDGRGRFAKAPAGALPTEYASGSRVLASDYDGDGDVDLFVGGRVVPWKYGAVAPRSMLLQNDGRGHFADVTDRVAPGLGAVGMVTDGAWQDVDGDRRADLVLVGEWMPVTVFRNAGGGRLAPLAAPSLARSHGWWNRIVAGDFTGDGRVDFVVGNLGLNARLQAAPGEPVTMTVKDFDGNGFAEQVLATYRQGKSYPLPLRDDLIKAIPPLKTRFLNYKDYARRTMDDVFPAEAMKGAVVHRAETFATTLVRNDGGGRFTLVPLPREAQLAPVYGILADDVDGDGRTDLLLGGNFDGVKPEIGRLGASYGLLLRGAAGGAFEPVRAAESGFRVEGQVRDIRRLRTAGGVRYVVLRNNDRPVVFRPAPRTAPRATVAVAPRR
jgi:hypothetical protein